MCLIHNPLCVFVAARHVPVGIPTCLIHLFLDWTNFSIWKHRKPWKRELRSLRATSRSRRLEPFWHWLIFLCTVCIAGRVTRCKLIKVYQKNSKDTRVIKVILVQHQPCAFSGSAASHHEGCLWKGRAQSRRKCCNFLFHLRSEAGGIIHHTPGRSFEAWHSRSGPRSKQTADPGANMLQVVSCGVGCLLFLLHS